MSFFLVVRFVFSSILCLFFCLQHIPMACKSKLHNSMYSGSYCYSRLNSRRYAPPPKYFASTIPTAMATAQEHIKWALEHFFCDCHIETQIGRSQANKYQTMVYFPDILQLLNTSSAWVCAQCEAVHAQRTSIRTICSICPLFIPILIALEWLFPSNTAVTKRRAFFCSFHSIRASSFQFPPIKSYKKN